MKPDSSVISRVRRYLCRTLPLKDQIKSPDREISCRYHIFFVCSLPSSVTEHSRHTPSSPKTPRAVLTVFHVLRMCDHHGGDQRSSAAIWSITSRTPRIPISLLWGMSLHKPQATPVRRVKSPDSHRPAKPFFVFPLVNHKISVAPQWGIFLVILSSSFCRSQTLSIFPHDIQRG